ncbi:endocellulase [Mycena maculata]|uniref:Endocellulase n=1 Tax=Mycena maculata TaxID=230809 RepID=A0AAD7ILU3_9AGAR|nr:endocellulase [Mycena maculata]
MPFSTLVALSCLFSLGIAQTITGQYDCLPAGGFTLCQDLWNQSAGVGAQQTTLLDSSTETVSWSTNWTWANSPDNVKSYANAKSLLSNGIQLQNISSAPTSWHWSYETQSSDIRADVSYDIWFGTESSGDPASSASSYEVMIWLAGLGGAQPVGTQITTGTFIAGLTWNLWKATNTNWEVFFFASAIGDINSFDVDLNDFFKYLVEEQCVAPTQYVQGIQAGTEAFVGAGNLVTTAYSVSILPT